MTEVTQISDGNNVMSTNDLIDAVEYVMINEMVGSGEFVLIQAPVQHEFTDGQYIRTITMPTGSRFTSSIHKFKHPYYILKGKLTVFSENDGVQFIEAPFRGITKPGTRRVLNIIEETVFSTVHRTDIVPKDDSEEEIERAAEMVIIEITELHENKLLGGYYRNSVYYESKEELEFNIQNKSQCQAQL